MRESIINGVRFFTNDVVATRSHARQTLQYSEKLDKFFREQRIYTSPRGHEQRIDNNTKIKISNFASIEPYSMFLQGNLFYTMGAFSSSNSALPVNTIVGRYSSIARNVKRLYGNHPMDRFTTSMLTYDQKVTAYQDYLSDTGKKFEQVANRIPNNSPLIIGNDVWIGQDVSFVSTGITVGNGAVIAAGALVTKDVPPYAVVGGVPAKIIKYRFSKEIIQKLEELEWWQYSYADFESVNGDTKIEDFIGIIYKLKKSGQIKPLELPVISVHEILKLF